MDELDRIKKIMQAEELNSAQFAAEIGIQGSTLSHILNSRNKPSLDVYKKILNRFRTLSSDWLILGVGSMYRSEKQSQTPTLFDSMDESHLKSGTLEPKTTQKNDVTFSTIQQKNQSVQQNSVQLPPEVPQSPIFTPLLESSSRSVSKIIVYYTDNTFEEFRPK